MSKKRLVEEILICIVGIVVLVGVIGVIATWGHAPIYDTSKLPQNIVYVKYAEINPDGKLVRYWVTWFRIGSIATLSEDKVIITIPEGNLRMFRVSKSYIEAHKNDTLVISAVQIGTGITWSDLASHGFNKYYYYLKADTNVSEFGLGNGWRSIIKFNASKIEGSGYVDPANVVSMAYFAGTSGVSIVIKPQNPVETATFTLAIKLYGNKKPVLEGFVKPIYSLFAGFIAAILAAVSKLRRISLHAIGGFSFSSILSGLVGNPIIAAVIAIGVIALAFYALHKPIPRRRRA